MSKQAYQRGVVIIKCEGCGSKHLIADHLGWFDSVGGRMGTIEEIMERAGREGEVRRVSFAEELHAEVESMEKGKVEVRRQFEGEIVDGGGRVGAKVEQKVEGETTLDKEKIKEIEALGEGLMEWLPKLADEAAAGDGVVNLSKRS
ncbi:hypothetical protein HK101_010649 [Irineochytrium annulatum]|nr:hypothetical protein HK101_010649 [Irineochytrium annulatum]